MTFQLKEIFNACDIRGIVGKTINEEIVFAIGAATVDILKLVGKTILVGGDMRSSTNDFINSFSKSVNARGANVILLGQCSTDQLYFSSGYFDYPGVMFTASHNPSEYNGIKLCNSGAMPISSNNLLFDIRDLAQHYLDNGLSKNIQPTGRIKRRDTLKDYSKYLHKLVNIKNIRKLKVVIDAGNGMAGKTAPAVFDKNLCSSLNIIPLYFKLDGSFPNHPANPLDSNNLKDLKKEVLKQKADIGLAFDGDADRCFFIDEKGQEVPPSVIIVMIGINEIKHFHDKKSKPIILHNLVTSRSVPEILHKKGAVTFETKVGHSFIKAEMAKTGAIFGGEHSAHFYFRNFFNADSGMLAAMHVIAMLGGQNLPLSEFNKKFSLYFSSGEINFSVKNINTAVDRIIKFFTPISTVTTKDGWTFTSLDKMWWFNIRTSNTESFLRLNVESSNKNEMENIKNKVLQLIHH